MNPSKIKGTRWETQVVDHLRANGVPHAERRALGGSQDRGDIAGIPGVVIECKSTVRVALAEWVDEAEAERVNDRADLAVVWVKRRGRASPGAGYAVLTGEALLLLLAAAGYIAPADAYIAQRRAAR